MNTNRVTLKDISQRLSVSPTTVANALKGNCNVSDELKKKILAEAEELGYKPNFTAKAMVKNGISIALLQTEEPAEFVKYLRKSIIDEVERLSDFKVSLTEYIYHDNTSAAEAYDCVQKLVQHKYDGILFGETFENESYIGLMKKYMQENPQTKVVYVMYGDTVENGVPYVSRVSADSEAIGKMVAQLIHLKYGSGAKIGVITTSSKYASHKRIVGTFTEECKSYGMEIADILFNNDSKVGTYTCTSRLISGHPDLDVIYVTSFDSVHACKCIENKGLQNKIKVIAHDVYKGMIPYMQSGQQIASIYQNQNESGRACVRTLFNAIMGEETKEKVINIRPEIVLKSNLDMYIKEMLKIDASLME